MTIIPDIIQLHLNNEIFEVKEAIVTDFRKFMMKKETSSLDLKSKNLTKIPAGKLAKSLGTLPYKTVVIAHATILMVHLVKCTLKWMIMSAMVS